jgi:serine/threonine-protein phosphatase 2A catalytic subunit
MGSAVVDPILEKLERGFFPSLDEVLFLSAQVTALFQRLPNVVRLPPPVTICGDIHGQFKDLIELFTIGGPVPYTSYLFLGDYVDRGPQSLEVVIYLFALKVKHPQHVTLLRGNHETAGLSHHSGFRDEVIDRYGDDHVWKVYTDTFNVMPLAALVGGKILCLHGGLSPELRTIADIDAIDRFRELPRAGPLCDLVWSDPAGVIGFQPSGREAGFQFGADVTRQWNQANGLELTVRAHQFVMTGLEYLHNDQLATVFSAPDYCMRCGNQAAMLEVDEKLRRRVIRFGAARQRCDGAGFFSYD